MIKWTVEAEKLTLEEHDKCTTKIVNKVEEFVLLNGDLIKEHITNNLEIMITAIGTFNTELGRVEELIPMSIIVNLATINLVLGAYALYTVLDKVILKND